ncbi:MAG: ABC transporter ATP-binding protein, partial [Armatimonadota bacterium]
MVRAEGLTKRYHDRKRGEVRAVDGVTFSAQPGEIVGLLGQNGAGKSTFLRILSTAIRATSGSAIVADVDVNTDPTAVRRQIGFLSNSTALYSRLTPRESLRFFGGLYGLRGSDLDHRITAAIERFQIGSYADGLADKLSTGQRQRVSIARAVLHDPPVLFFDEPTTGLDILSAQDVMEFVEEARSVGKTIIYCTHILSEAERLCDRISIIHEGKIRGEGTLASLKEETGATTL